MPPLNSIRARVTAAFTLAVALLMLSTCALVLVFARSRAESEKASALRSAARTFATEVGKGDRKAALAEMDEEDADLRSRGILLTLREATGNELAEVGSHRRTLHAGAGERTLSTHIGADTAVFSLSWSEEKRNLTRQAAELAVVTAVITLAAGLGAWTLVGHTLAPIRALSRQANVASAETLSVRLEPSSDDAEVVDLVRTLNGLLARLSQAASARGRFYAAASHELRTPLQALLGHLELGAARDRSPEEYRAVLEEASRQANRLIVLTRDLLILNRLESGAAPSAPEPVDLVDVTEHAIRQIQSIAEQRRLRVSMEAPDALVLPISPGHAEMLIRNLVDNAAKYAAEGGAVRVDIRDNPARLDVYNDAPPLPESEMERLFEPFYRPDASRCADTGGNGLGLAICHAIARADGWMLSLEQTEGGFHAAAVFSRSPVHLHTSSLPV